MKAFMKSLLQRTPYQLVKQNRRISMTQVLEQMKRLGLNPDTVIDVGVGYGTSELYCFPSAAYLLVEAVREFEPHMQEIMKGKRGRYLIAAAGPQKGEMSIKVRPNNLQASTFFNESGGGDGQPRTVPVITIDDVAPPGPVLLKLDIQGAELLALSGATETLKRTEAVLMEVQVMPCLADAPSFAEVVAFMRERNFVAYDFFGGAYRPLDEAVASLDMVFVQENGKFRKNRNWSSTIAA